MEGQIRCLRLELETRLSIEVTTAMNVWPWLVRHAGWLLERYHVQGNKKTAFEDCFGKPYQGEEMKFAEAALFRVAMSPSGRNRDGLRQGRADASFVRGMWLGKTTESDEHLFANEMEVHTTRTVKRVPDTEQKRADLVKGLQGTPWNRLAGRPAGRPRKTDPQATLRCDISISKKETERPSEDADERRSAKPQDLNPPVPHVIRVPRAADTENEPRSPSSRPTETEDGGARGNTASDDRAQVGSPAPAPSRPMEQTDQSDGHKVKSVNQPEQSKSNMGSGVKRDARAAELPDEDEQGGKFQQVEGLTTVDAEEIPCEISVEDDFLIDENAEGVDEEIVKTIVTGKKKELDAMEAFGIFDVCEELPKDAKVITTRWEDVPKSDKWRCRFVAREFRHDDQEMEGLYTSGSTAATDRLVDMHAVQHGCSVLCLDAESAYFHAEEDEDVYYWPPKEMGAEVPRQRWTSGEPLVATEETPLWETESCEEVQ